MKKYVTIEKQVGETPLFTLEHLRETDPLLANTPLAYAGRLDPMASGKLLVLIGEECKKQSSYHGLDKEYEFEVLFGFSSDTGDVLGVATKTPSLNTLSPQLIASAAKKLVGTRKLPYPHFSSKTVQGKPLFLWTLENRLDEIEIPTIESEIYRVSLLEVHTEPVDAVIPKILNKINLIPPVTDETKRLGQDFRREEIRVRWNELQSQSKNEQVTIATLRAVVSSGTYIRSLAPLIAQNLGTTGLAYSIHRTKIGTFKKIFSSFGFWARHY